MGLKLQRGAVQQTCERLLEFLPRGLHLHPGLDCLVALLIPDDEAPAIVKIRQHARALASLVNG